MESLEIDPCKYNQPILDKETKIIQWNFKVVSSTKAAWTTGHPHAKKYIYFYIDLIPSWKINSKWIIDINVKNNCKTRGNWGENLDDLLYGWWLLTATQKAQPMKKQLIGWTSLK